MLEQWKILTIILLSLNMNIQSVKTKSYRMKFSTKFNNTKRFRDTKFDIVFMKEILKRNIKSTHGVYNYLVYSKKFHYDEFYSEKDIIFEENPFKAEYGALFLSNDTLKKSWF